MSRDNAHGSEFRQIKFLARFFEKNFFTDEKTALLFFAGARTILRVFEVRAFARGNGGNAGFARGKSGHHRAGFPVKAGAMRRKVR